MLVLEYDGTKFHGWQIQPDQVTVQGEIEKALSVMTNKYIEVHGSGRTDAGVHAFAQTASFSCETKITPLSFRKGLNCLLPDGVVVHECKEVDIDFHARFSAKFKIYEYKILNKEIRPVIGKDYVWHLWKKLDLESMKKASEYFIGEKDFKSFEASGSPRSHTIRNLTDLNVNDYGAGNISIEVTANGFLRYMVRNITGTLVQVGLGKYSPEDVDIMIRKKERAAAGMTAPPYGLFLKKVIY